MKREKRPRLIGKRLNEINTTSPGDRGGVSSWGGLAVSLSLIEV